MTKIRIIGGVAKHEVEIFIGKLEGLKGHAGAEGEINSHEEWQKAFAPLQELDKGVVGYLKSRIFTDVVPALEYKRLSFKPIDDDRNWLENKSALLGAIEQRIAWLQNLRTTIDKMEQSENAITGRFRSLE